MLEPTWNPSAGTRRMLRSDRYVEANGPQRARWLLEAAPCAAAAVWVGITLAGMIGFALTGRRELLDWCRSDVVVAGAGTVAAVGALAGSLREGTRR